MWKDATPSLVIRTLLWFVATVFCEDVPTNDIRDMMKASDDVVDINTNITRDENHPMLKVIETKPHSMTLQIKPKIYKPDTMIRLLYERVPLNKGPFMLHLDDPVIEIIPLPKQEESLVLSDLPMGKYIVCGEAMVKGEVYQSSCFETRIERLDNNSELKSKIHEDLLFFHISSSSIWSEGDHRCCHSSRDSCCHLRHSLSDVEDL